MLPMLDRQNSEQWQSLLHQHVAATRQMNLKHDESSIHEELNLAWAGDASCAGLADQLRCIALSMLRLIWLHEISCLQIVRSK